MTSGDGVEAARLGECLMSESWWVILVFLAESFVAASSNEKSVRVPRLHPKQQTLLSMITLDAI